MKPDSDSDGSLDPDLDVQFSNALTRSVFNITQELPDDDLGDENKITDYEKRLNDEINEWLSLLKRTKETITESTSTVKSTDYSVLSEDKLAYLRRAPDLNKFIEDSIEFQKQAKVYLEVDYAEALELHENLIELCNNRLNTKKSHLIEEYIFNSQRPQREIN